MKRLILWTLTLFLLTTALTGGVVAYARTHSENPLKAYGFDVCENMPCFMGVTVGMDWNTAKMMLTTRNQSAIETDDGIKITINGLDFSIFPDTEGNNVNMIEVSYGDSIDYVDPRRQWSISSLASFILLFGPPCQVSSLDLEGLFILYDDMSLVVRPIGKRLSPFSNAYKFQIWGSEHCTGYFANHWSGFAALVRYHFGK